MRSSQCVSEASRPVETQTGIVQYGSQINTWDGSKADGPTEVVFMLGF